MAKNKMTQGESLTAHVLATALQSLIAAANPEAAKVKGFENIEAELTWDTTSKKITLPGDPTNMKEQEAIDWLQRKIELDEEIIAFNETIDTFPWDGAVAFMAALKEIYGWARPVPTPGFFGPKPPTLINIETGVGETSAIFWGKFALPGIIEMDIACGTAEKDDRTIFAITGQCARKHLAVVMAIAAKVREIARERSIYRGKAVRFITNPAGKLDFSKPPKFLDLRGVKEEELVFSQDVQEMFEANVLAPIENSQQFRDEQIPLKMGVLFEGPYGTGKTFAASVVAKVCERHGWMFVTVGRVTALEAALHFAALYQPVCVFVEDIDREMSGERTKEMDDILNTVDGIVSKGSEIMVVLTSNHAELINRAMLRPGRLDAVIHIGPPDAEAAARLVRVYGRERLHPDEVLVEAGKELEGQIPAVIREVVERAKRFAIAARPGQPFKLVDNDIARSARTMKHHLALLKGIEKEASREERLGAALVDVINHGLVNGHDDGASKVLKDTGENTDFTRRLLTNLANKLGVQLPK